VQDLQHANEYQQDADAPQRPLGGAKRSDDREEADGGNDQRQGGERWAYGGGAKQPARQEKVQALQRLAFIVRTLVRADTALYETFVRRPPAEARPELPVFRCSSASVDAGPTPRGGAR